MSLPRIGIIGNGVVGSATARSYLEHTEVRVHDVNPLRRTCSLEDVVAYSEVTFLCLPTPLNEEKGCLDISAVEDTCRTLANLHPSGVYVLRSTVPIGTTRRLREQYCLPNLVHSPEFLTARCSYVDAQVPSRNIVGGQRTKSALENTSWRGVAILKGLYEQRFPYVPVQVMTSDESEAVKLLQNSFFAAKVALFNEFYQMCEAKGLDWQTVLGGILSDGRIHPSHTQVPGPDGRFGAGGTCLPKDLAQTVWEMRQLGPSVHPTMLDAARIRNYDDREEKQ